MYFRRFTILIRWIVTPAAGVVAGKGPMFDRRGIRDRH